MNSKTIGVMIAITLCGCSAAPPKDDLAASGRPDLRPAAYRQEQADGGAHAGRWAVAVAGTPFFIAFKTVVCGASLVVAAPTAAVLALAEGADGEGIATLGDGLAYNCGPPYVLSPY